MPIKSLLLGDGVDHVEKNTDADLPENAEETFDECDHNKPVLKFNNIPPDRGRTDNMYFVGDGWTSDAWLDSHTAGFLCHLYLVNERARQVSHERCGPETGLCTSDLPRTNIRNNAEITKILSYKGMRRTQPPHPRCYPFTGAV